MKTVIISGASSGIGAATVQRFLAEGYFVFGLDIQPSTVNHKNLNYINCDIAKTGDIQKAAQLIVESGKVVDALVCNAGVHFSANILDSTEIDYDHIFNVNVKGSFFLTQAILPLMLKQKKGAIVYVGSDQTLIAHKNSAIYATTKAALSGLAKSTAIDFAHLGIRANIIAAGTIETPLYHKAIQNYCQRAGADINAVHEAEAAEQPVNRIGQPHEIASLIYFLCSDEALFITGAVVPIDGGYTAR